MKPSLWVLVVVLSTALPPALAADKPASKQVEIARALSAGPTALRAGAVVSMDDKGRETELRTGNNVAFRTIPLRHWVPVCVDQSGWAWFRRR